MGNNYIYNDIENHNYKNYKEKKIQQAVNNIQVGPEVGIQNINRYNIEAGGQN